MKIVINKCYGGFGLSKDAEKEYGDQTGIQLSGMMVWEIKRNDPILVDIVEKMGDTASGSCSKLKVVDIPDDVDWVIDEYDGMEWVAERHRTWS